jgi:hypothetical protein
MVRTVGDIVNPATGDSFLPDWFTTWRVLLSFVPMPGG